MDNIKQRLERKPSETLAKFTTMYTFVAKQAMTLKSKQKKRVMREKKAENKAIFLYKLRRCRHKKDRILNPTTTTTTTTRT